MSALLRIAVEGNRLMTKEGWPGEPRECKILYEELFYNSAWRKFRVVCIDGALVGGLPPGQVDAQPALPSLAQRTLKACCHMARVLVALTSMRFACPLEQNCKAYLESYPENELVLRKIRQYVEQFVASYYIVKGCASPHRCHLCAAHSLTALRTASSTTRARRCAGS